MSEESEEHKPKATNAEMEIRINKVYDLLVNGVERAKIIQYVAEKTQWGVDERQIDNYIKRATEMLIEAGKTARELELGRAITRLHNLYFLSVSLQNLSVGLGVQKEINKLIGLHLEQTLLKRIKELEERERKRKIIDKAFGR